MWRARAKPNNKGTNMKGCVIRWEKRGVMGLKQWFTKSPRCPGSQQSEFSYAKNTMIFFFKAITKAHGMEFSHMHPSSLISRKWDFIFCVHIKPQRVHMSVK